MPIAGSNPTLDTREGFDKVTITEKVTSPYFSDGNTELLAASITTQSLADSNETYYFGIANSSTATTPEFHVAYGHVDGNGGNDYGNTITSPTETIYKQWSNVVLAPTEVTGGFYISSTGGVPTQTTKDSEIFVVTSRRSNTKDRLNKKNWTIVLTGSLQNGVDGAPKLSLTDDSSDDSPTATPVGDRYNIVSGSDGTVAVTAAAGKVYGWFYPDIGTMIFSGAELSASLPGYTGSLDSVVTFNNEAQKGFGCTSNQDNNYNSALRFVNCLTGTGAKLKFRDEEDQVSAQYFCRVRAGQLNFSNNPTFVSGSMNELRHTTMKGNPTTFISQVQLYNAAGDVVAVGNLSTPLKKNFSSEATIKVKLTY